MRHADKLVRLDPPEIRREMEKLADRRRDTSYSLSLIGMRELRSLNSWMHNAPKLMAGNRRHSIRIHPRDAAGAGIKDGDTVRVTSKTNVVELPALLTKEMIPGSIAIPHGWGHRGGWRLARRQPGANANLLASTALVDLDPLSGTPLLDGISVRIERVADEDVDQTVATALAIAGPTAS